MSTKEELKNWIGKIETRGEYCLDLETTSLNPHTGRIEIVALAVNSGDQIETTHFSFVPDYSNYIPFVLFKRHFQKTLQNSNIEVVMWNGKFDEAFLLENGFTINNQLRDAMVGLYLLDENRNSFKLKDTVRKDILSDDEQDEIQTYEETVALDNISKEMREEIKKNENLKDLEEYAEDDVYYTLTLWNQYRKLLKEQNLMGLFNNIEMPVTRSIREMERAGIKIDTDWLDELLTEYERKLEDLPKEIYELAPSPKPQDTLLFGEVSQENYEFNLNSGDDLRQVFFQNLTEEQEKELDRTDKTEVLKTNKENLQRLASLKPEYSEAIEKLLEYKEVKKLHSTYLESFKERIENSHDERLRGAFHQHGTKVGRLSSSNPNLQNIPRDKKFRKLFASEEGWKMVGGDLGQIELRMLAHVSGDEKLVEVFKEGEDIHQTTADMVGCSRQIAKMINYLTQYGGTAWTLKKRYYQRTGNEMSKNKAKEYINNFYNSYTGVKGWKEKVRLEVKKNREVKTIFGRRRRLGTVCEKSGVDRAVKLAVHSITAGSAADLIKLIMKNIRKRINNEKKANKEFEKIIPLLQVHDELIYEVPEDIKSPAFDIISHEMTKFDGYRVPIEADVVIGNSWDEIK